jgi:trimethylamine--corrinoid protein Co-methyltransferase
MHKRFMGGLEVNDTTLALDVIKEVGPAGLFLGHQHTLDHFRELWDPTLLSWEPRDIWTTRGSKTMGDRAKEKVAKLRAEHSVDQLPDGVLAMMRAVIERRAAILPEDD